MSISIVGSRGTRKVVVTGPASIRVVSEARQALLGLLAEGRPARIDLTAAPSADVAFVQLVIAARRGFSLAGIALDVADPQGVLTHVIPCREDGDTQLV